MQRSRISFLIGLALVALSSIVAAPVRAFDRGRAFVVDLFAGFPILVDYRAFRDLFRPDPALAIVGPPISEIDPALANEQKHEAGLARLGTVRHL